MDLNDLVIDDILGVYMVDTKTGEQTWMPKDQIILTSSTNQKTDEEKEEYRKHVGHGIFDG